LASRKFTFCRSQAYPLTPAAGASLGYIIGALLALGTNLILFFVDADQLGSSGAPDSTAKKNKGRKGGGQVKKFLTKQD